MKNIEQYKGETIRETIANLWATFPPRNNRSEDDPQYGVILNAACWLHRSEGWGMVGRSDGGIEAPSGDHIDFDGVCKPGRLTGRIVEAYDVFEADDHHPGWRDMIHDIGGDNFWSAPVAPEESSETPDEPSIDDLADIHKALKALEDTITDLGSAGDRLVGVVNTLLERVNTLEEQSSQVLHSGDTISLESDHGTFLRAGDTGEINQAHQVDGWELWKVKKE